MKKTTSIILTAIVLIIVIITAVWLNKKNAATQESRDEQPSASALIITQEEIAEPNFTGTRPVISGSTALATMARTYIDQTIATFKATADAEVPERRKEFGEDLPPSHYTVELHANYVQSQTTESIIIDGYIYMGGANGNSTYKVFTADRADGAILTISDVITTQQQAAFTDYIKKVLLSAPELSVFPEEVEKLTFASFSNFSLDDEALTLYFDKYQIGPGALGAVAYPLPRTSLQQFLTL